MPILSASPGLCPLFKLGVFFAALNFTYLSFMQIHAGYTGALKAPIRCFGNHLSGKRKSRFWTDNECGGAAILKNRTSRLGRQLVVNDYSLIAGFNPYTSLIER